MISLIACLDRNDGIGAAGSIPWSLSPDIKHFRKLTTGSIVIMGRKTWISIGSKPLPNRINIVITSKPCLILDAIACIDLKYALELANTLLKPIFIIGGTSLYRDTISLATNIYLTRIDQNYDCDTFFPTDIIKGFNCKIGPWLHYNDIRYRFETHYRA